MVETRSARTRLVRFGGSSLDLDVFVYVLTDDYATTYLSRGSGLDGTRAKEAIEAVGRWREKKVRFPNFQQRRPQDTAPRRASTTNPVEIPRVSRPAPGPRTSRWE